LIAQLGIDEASVTSTMALRKVDRSDAALLHDQVAAQIRAAIADGEAGQGERLPPTRDLAAVLGVNQNTVLSAFRTLRDEGLLEFGRGRSVRVAGTPERAALITKTEELLALARRHGLGRDDLVGLIRQLP
jgi:GntR family transcriptional regulator